MKQKQHRTWSLAASVLLLAGLLAYGVWLVTAVPAAAKTALDVGAVTLDGERDADYILIATDPAGDLANPGPGTWSGVAWTDLTNLYVTADADYLYVYVDAAAYNDTDSTGQIGLALDVDGQPQSGGASDPWGNAITFSYTGLDGFTADRPLLPDYLIRGNVSRDGGWTELRTWANGNWDTGGGVNWGGINGGHVGTNIAYSFGNGIELAIPLADIGDPNPADVRLQFLATQSGGGKGAYDTVPSDDQSTGWDDPTEQSQLVSVPLATDPEGDLAADQSGWNGVAWTDQTRMHIWADNNSLQIFLPMEAYSSTLSQGQIVFAFDTQDGGGSSDPWGNAITFAYTATHRNLGSEPVLTDTAVLPDYIIRGNIFGDGHNGWTELRSWNGSNWDTGSGVDWGGIGNTGQGSTSISNIAWSDGDGLRVRIPFADLGLAAGDMVNMQFIGTQGGGGKGAYDTVAEDDQSNAWDDPTTQQYWATYEVPAISSGGAAQDNNIFWDDLGHDSRDTMYRTPGGAVISGTAVTLRLRAASNDLTAARVRVYNDRTNVQTLHNMTKVADDGTYEWWQVVLPASADPTLYWYRFIAMDGTAVAYYEDDAARDGGWGKTFGTVQDNSWQLSIYDPAFTTPDWVQNAVMYQIFPDRFRDGDSTNDPEPGRFFYNEGNGTIYRSDPAGGMDNGWNTVVCDPRDTSSDCEGSYSLNFYGGDLQGVIDQLDYLDDLGVTAIYFNPIFESPSNHKYDTGNYHNIAEDFGDLQTFITLTTEAHNRGMKVILDGVFNHTSSDSVFFDRYSRFDADGTVTSPGGPGVNDGSGACESQNSPYRDWYYFTDVLAGTGTCAGSDGTPNGANYESWFGFDSLPKLNAANPDVRDLIFSGPDSVAMEWLAYADGWRFDVGGDIDPGLANDPDNDFWEEFRATVRATYPDTYLVIEEWGNASSWLLGNEMDATMNYQYGSAVLSFWRDTTFTDNDHNTGSSAGVLAPLTPAELDGRLLNWIERYPEPAMNAMMNLLDSHDTNRALFLLDHNAADAQDDTLLQDPNYDWSENIARLKGVAILQMTVPGAPTIYYGDEVGLVGPTYFHGGKWEDDPYNRQPFPWLDETGTPFYTHLQTQAGQDDLLDHYKLLTAARNSHEALRTGSFDPLLVDDDAMVYAYGRTTADDAAIVLVNRDGSMSSPVTQTVALNVAGYLPVGAQFDDVLSSNTYTVDGSGLLSVEVPGQSGAVLVLTSVLDAAPGAVTDLAVTDERSEEVDLGWTAVADADSYDIYRSLVYGGGYEWIANTTNITYTDSGLTNAVTYYYVVVSKDDTTMLTSDYSNEVSGTPQHTLGWYNLQWPHEFTHIISAITETENIYAQVWIDGATGSTNGPADGVRAQIGYAISGTSPVTPTWWTWVEMEFHSFDGSNDQYATNLLPDEVGDYHYISRWSTDGGNNWSYSDLGGPGPIDNPGVMHVIASDDTTAPADTMLYLDGTTASSVSLSWDAVADADLHGYEVYRQDAAPFGAMNFTRIARVDASTTSYVDEAVTTDQSYDYYVVAFDTSFNRSAPSNIITATAEARFVEVTFQVAAPEYTPGNVYMAGSADVLGPWNPSAVLLNRVGTSNIYTTTVQILDGTEVQYKYTRGSWDTVESWGSIIVFTNRELLVEYGADGTMLVDDTATDWGNGPDDRKAVQFWRDPIVIDYGPTGTNIGLEPEITVTWSISMVAGTDFTVSGPAGVVAGTFSNDGVTKMTTFVPDAPLAYATTYTVTVAGEQGTSAPGAESGTQQVPVVFTFTTEEEEEPPVTEYIIFMPVLAKP